MVGLIGFDIAAATKSTSINNNKEACSLVQSFIGTSERTLRKWRGEFYDEGEIRNSRRGGNHKNPLTADENIKIKAIDWLRRATTKKNNCLHVNNFCRWVNDILIPGENLPHNYPRSISRVTAWRWMNSLGFH